MMKLVRSKIAFRRKGDDKRVRVPCDDRETKALLCEKLLEEAKETADALEALYKADAAFGPTVKERDKLMDEMADVLEVLHCIARETGMAMAMIHDVARDKAGTKGHLYPYRVMHFE